MATSDVADADRLSRIGAVLFALFAVGFTISALVHLAGDQDLAQNRPEHVLLYAGAAVPLLAVGALAAWRVRNETYVRWLLIFEFLFLAWAAMTFITLLRIDDEGVPTVILHAIAGVAGALTIFLMRRVARARR